MEWSLYSIPSRSAPFHCVPFHSAPFYSVNPNRAWVHMDSSISTGIRTVGTHEDTGRTRASYLSNGARTSIILSLPIDIPRWYTPLSLWHLLDTPFNIREVDPSNINISRDIYTYVKTWHLILIPRKMRQSVYSYNRVYAFVLSHFKTKVD